MHLFQQDALNLWTHLQVLDLLQDWLPLDSDLCPLHVHQLPLQLVQPALGHVQAFFQAVHVPHGGVQVVAAGGHADVKVVVFRHHFICFTDSQFSVLLSETSLSTCSYLLRHNTLTTKTLFLEVQQPRDL